MRMITAARSHLVARARSATSELRRVQLNVLGMDREIAPTPCVWP